MGNEEKKKFTLTRDTLSRIDTVSNIGSGTRFTTMRVVIFENGRLGAITEEEARQVEEQMREEANPLAVRAHG